MQRHLEKLDFLIKYTVAAIILAIPLYPKFPFIRIPGTFVSIRLEDLIIAFAAILVFIKTAPRLNEFFKSKLTQSILLYLAVGLISLTSGVLVTKTVILHIGVLHWLRRIEYFVPLFLGLLAVKTDRKNLDFYLKTLLITLFVTFLYGWGQRFLHWPIVNTQNQEYSKGVALWWVPGSHINSTFAGHYDLATFLVLVLPIVVTAMFLVKEIKSKVVLGAVFLAGLWLLVISASRISLASYLLSATLALYLIRRYKMIAVIIMISLAFTMFSSNLLSRYKRVIEVSTTKIRQLELINYDFSPKEVLASTEIEVSTPTMVPVFEDRSTNIRLNVEWPRAFRAWAKNPFLGTGYSSITLATDNDYFRLLGEVGLMGFFAFFLIFVRIAQVFLKAIPLYKKGWRDNVFQRFDSLELAFIIGAISSLPGLFLNAVFIDIFEASKFAIIFWLLMGLALGLVNYKINEENN